MWKTVTRLRVHVGLLAGFLLLVHLCLLMPGVAPRWFGCVFLACAGRMSYMPIPGLRVLLRCLAGWSWFFGMMAFLLALYEFGARSTFLGWTPTARTFLWCHGKRGQPGVFLKVLLHLLAWGGYSSEAGPTCEIRIVMHADNVVEVGRIILDGVHAEWATRHAWLVPVLGFFRPVNKDMSKCALHMQFLQQTQRCNRSTLENNDNIWPSLCVCEEQQTIYMVCCGQLFQRCKHRHVRVRVVKAT